MVFAFALIYKDNKKPGNSIIINISLLGTLFIYLKSLHKKHSAHKCKYVLTLNLIFVFGRLKFPDTERNCHKAGWQSNNTGLQ